MAYQLSRREVRRPDPIEDLRRQMDELVEDFTGEWTGLAGSPRSHSLRALFVPEIDVDETDNEIRIAVELPGVDPKDVHVSFLQGTLRIEGEKREERAAGSRRGQVAECRFGRFQRVLSLPPDADPDRAKAEIRHGVLSVTMPKKQGSVAGRRKIEISEAHESDRRQDSGEPGGGAGQTGVVRGSGVYPPGEPAPQDAEEKAERAWGQGERGAAGYEDSGRSGLDNPSADQHPEDRQV